MKSSKPKKIRHPKPTLYFTGWGYDDRQEYPYTDEGAEVLVVKTAGQALILRKMGNYVFFRRQDDPDERASLFLLEPQVHRWKEKINEFSPQLFAEAYKKQVYGRCLLYVADFMHEYQCVFLCFAPDGTGFSIDYNEERMVDFRWQDVTPITWPELLAASSEVLRPLCQRVFDILVHPRLVNPYIDPTKLKKIPHRFVCGSKAELYRLTTIIVQTEPELFEKNLTPVTVSYRAQTPTKRAYMMRVERGRDKYYHGEYITDGLGRLHSLCDLALRLNTFTGVKWETGREKPNRLGDFHKRVRLMRIEVPPPSAHERAESLLMLADWLEGKVSGEKRLRLLGIDAE